MIPTWPPFTPDPGRKQVALVGFAASSLHLVPWTDPTWEVWGLNQSYIHFERAPDRWFEIHRPEAREDIAVPDYLTDLKTLGCPVYMIERDPAYPTSVAYPLAEVRATVPTLYHRYFTCGVTYMIALALLEGFETIALYGIDCATGTEYAEQKPGIEAWCSLAMGRGVTIVIPPQSALFKAPFLYGYEPPRRFAPVLRASSAWLRSRRDGYKAVSNDKLADLHRLEGAIEELDALIAFAESVGRGTSFPTVEGKA